MRARRGYRIGGQSRADAPVRCADERTGHTGDGLVATIRRCPRGPRLRGGRTPWQSPRGPAGIRPRCRDGPRHLPGSNLQDARGNRRRVARPRHRAGGSDAGSQAPRGRARWSAGRPRRSGDRRAGDRLRRRRDQPHRGPPPAPDGARAGRDRQRHGLRLGRPPRPPGRAGTGRPGQGHQSAHWLDLTRRPC
ncbi:MAG: hypothetical protein HW391_1066 [Chloroflexi bacterium]|nr:hypothetical protein [Chloroflexota bacterium]